MVKYIAWKQHTSMIFYWIITSEFLLAERILWKENIVIEKGIHFVIFAYLCDVYICVCKWVNSIASKTVHSTDRRFGMYITGNHRTNLIDFGEYRMHSFFYRSTRKNSYTLRPMESYSLKCSNIQMVHSNELKYGMYIIGRCSINCTDFGELRINSFFLQEHKKEFLYITAYRVKL